MQRKRTAFLVLIAIACINGNAPARADDSQAVAITANIQARHVPYGTILDPMYASASNDQIVGYTRCGDSALWTGFYLAAEAFRYKVTGAADALTNVKGAIAGIQSLVNVTGTNLLARCMVPMSSLYAAGIESEEAANGVYTNKAAAAVWIGNTSRDEYCGVIFGLGVAYDMVNDPGVQSSISQLVTQLIDFLITNHWFIVMPGEFFSTTTFVLRPDELLSLLQVAQHVNPSHFATEFTDQSDFLLDELSIPIGVDVAGGTSSYFKFNLDYISLYNLIRLDTNSTAEYREAYAILRDYTATHQNAFFDMVDRAVNGPNAARDAETTALLGAWLQRPERDPDVDLTSLVPVCSGEACQPIAVPLRVPTDFLWQRDPFQLSGGGSGTIESPGIDYILPYWMSRYYNLGPQPTIQSAAASIVTVAPQSIASLYGSNLAPSTAQAMTTPLPTNLGGVTLTVVDSAGQSRLAQLLFVSSGQINFVVPSGTAIGLAEFQVGGGGSVSAPGTVLNAAPTLFSANGNGVGVAAATAFQLSSSGQQMPVPVFQCSASGCVSAPIALSASAPVYLTLYGTGIRGGGSSSNVTVTINGISVPVLFAGAQPSFTGLDQVNVQLPTSLQGSGETNIVLTTGGQTANPVTINIL